MDIDCVMNSVGAVIESEARSLPCRRVRDIHLKQEVLLDGQSSIAEATAHLHHLCIGSLPMALSPSDDEKALSSALVIDAKSILRELVNKFVENAITLDAFFALPLDHVEPSPGCVVGMDLPLHAAVGRMYHEKSELLLVYDRLCLAGMVTSAAILDEVISMNVFGDTMFDMSQIRPADTARSGPKYFKQPVGPLAEKPPVIQLNADNTLLTAIRILLNPRYDYLFLSDYQYQSYQFVTPEMVLHALLDYCREHESISLRKGLMKRLGAFFDFSSIRLTAQTSVFEATETMRFNDLRCVPVYSDDDQLAGIVTRRSILKAFLDDADEMSF